MKGLAHPLLLDEDLGDHLWLAGEQYHICLLSCFDIGGSENFNDVCVRCKRPLEPARGLGSRNAGDEARGQQLRA